MRKFLERFKEPSSWSGFGLIASVFFNVPTTTIEIVTQAAVAVLGAIAVVVPEKKA